MDSSFVSYLLNFRRFTDMEALDDSRNCQTLGVSPAELGAYELLVTNAVTNPIKELTTTQTENFENSGTKHREVFEWACTDKYWVRCTNSEEDFLRAYCLPKGGMRKQFEQRHNVKQPTGGNNGTHRQPPKKLSPAERVRKAAGIGEFAVGAGGSEFDYLEHNRG